MEDVWAIAEAILAEISAALRQPDDCSEPLDALFRAYLGLYDGIERGTCPVTVDQLRTLGQAVMASPELAAEVSERRRQVLETVLAERFGYHVGDRALRRTLMTWSAVIAALYSSTSDLRGEPRSIVVESPLEYSPDLLRAAYQRVTGRSGLGEGGAAPGLTPPG
jgi:hypothetical protein